MSPSTPPGAKTVCKNIDPCGPWIDERLCSLFAHLLSKHSATITLGGSTRLQTAIVCCAFMFCWGHCASLLGGEALPDVFSLCDLCVVIGVSFPSLKK